MKLADLFYKDKPLFGLDIGHSSVKVMQLKLESGKKPLVEGYGMTNFPPEAVLNGVVANFDKLGGAIYGLFKNNLHGSIYTHRVACSLPTSHTYSRLMKIPEMPDNDIAEAISLEAEQYIPMPVNNLYIDYEITSRSPDGIELMMVATPKPIADSYIKLLESLHLEPIALEPTVNATSRLLSMTGDSHNEPAVLIDFGEITTDVAVFDKAMIVNSTLAGGGQLMTKLISQSLKLDEADAAEMKNKYGIGVSQNQQQIAQAIQPILDDLIKEVRKIMRYYNERVGEGGRQVSKIITSGGGANLQGIDQFLSNQLNLPATKLDPWPILDFGRLKKPAETERAAFLTVSGEALLNPKEIFV